MRVSEQEILAIYKRGYGTLIPPHGALFRAHRDFFQDRVHKMKGRISDHEDEVQIRTRYMVSPDGFVWEKHSDHHLTEQTSSIPGGWALSFYNENGGIHSRMECDREHHPQRVEYYASNSEVQESLSITTEHSDRLMQTYR